MSGTGQLKLGSDVMTLSPGDVLIIPYDKEGVLTSKKGIKYWCVYQTPIVSPDTIISKGTLDSDDEQTEEEYKAELQRLTAINAARMKQMRKQNKTGIKETQPIQEVDEIELTEDELNKVQQQKEICGEPGLLTNPREIRNALNQNKMAYKDPINKTLIDSDDVYKIDSRCYDKTQLRIWANSFIGRKSKPTVPHSRREFTRKELIDLGVEISFLDNIWNQPRN